MIRIQFRILHSFWWPIHSEMTERVTVSFFLSLWIDDRIEFDGPICQIKHTEKRNYIRTCWPAASRLLCDSYRINMFVVWASFAFVWLLGKIIVRIKSISKPETGLETWCEWPIGMVREQLHNQEQLPHNQKTIIRRMKFKRIIRKKKSDLRFSLCMLFSLWFSILKCKLNQMKFNNGML